MIYCNLYYNTGPDSDFKIRSPQEIKYILTIRNEQLFDIYGIYQAISTLPRLCRCTQERCEVYYAVRFILTWLQ